MSIPRVGQERAWAWLSVPSVWRFDLRWTFTWTCNDPRFPCRVVWHPDGRYLVDPCMDHHELVQRHYAERMERARCLTCNEIPRSAADNPEVAGEIPAGFDAWAEHARAQAAGLWKERKGWVPE